MGDIYLSAIRAAGGSNNIRKLSFKEFWEAVVRCALTAYDKISDADTLDKIRYIMCATAKPLPAMSTPDLTRRKLYCSCSAAVSFSTCGEPSTTTLPRP